MFIRDTGNKVKVTGITKPNFFMKYSWITLLALAIFLDPFVVHALTFTLPPEGSNVVGAVQTGDVRRGESLTDVARRYDIGYYELLEANPRLDPMNPRVGERIVIPTQFVLPNAARQGIVVNIAELRLYYYPEGTNTVVTMPMGIGRQGFETPVGDLRIIEKRKNPSWRAPQSVIADMAKRGVIIPEVIPPGPDNPLGDYAMRLSDPTYLIHGTNAPQGVGRRTSAGCLRMYPEDVEKLFYSVSVGTPVKIINQPFKAGWHGNQLYMEAHQPLAETKRAYGYNYQALWQEAITNATGNKPANIYWNKVDQTVKQQSGLPKVIGIAG